MWYNSLLPEASKRQASRYTYMHVVRDRFGSTLAAENLIVQTNN